MKGVAVYGQGDTQRHRAGAFAGTVWEPEVVLPAAYGNFVKKRGGRASPLHGSIWGAMRQRVSRSREEWNGTQLMEYVVDDVLHIRANLTQKPPLLFVQTVVHGIGHGSLFSAQALSTRENETIEEAQGLVCKKSTFKNTTAETARKAESVCAALPLRPLAWLCSSGIYHTTEFPKVKDDDDGFSSVLDLCDHVDFKATCIMHAVRGVVKKAEETRPGARASTFCPPERWGPHLRHCYWGVGSAITELPALLSISKYRVPRSFDRCRPDSTTFDPNTAALTASCVAGFLYKGLVTSSDTFIPADELANACREACETLRADDNPNMRAAFPVCADSFICTTHTNETNYDAFFNAHLIDGEMQHGRHRHHLLL